MPDRRPASGRLAMLLFVAWRNVWRNPVRSGLTISALAGGLTILLLYAALMEGVVQQMVRYATDISLGHVQVHRQAYIGEQDLYATLPWHYLERIEAELPAVSAAPRLYAAALASSGEESSGVLLKAIDPLREGRVTTLGEHLRSGRLSFAVALDAETQLPRHDVVIGAQLAKNMHLTPGAELVLITQATDGSIGNAIHRIAGVLKPVEPNFDRMGVLMSIAAYQDLMALEDGFHELALKGSDVGQVTALQAQVTALLARLQAEQPLDELGGAPRVRTWRELSAAVADMLDMSATMVYIIGAIVVGLASLGMVNTLLMAIHERSHEFGILYVIGMKRRWLLTMVLLESLFLALVSAALGMLLATLAARYLEQHGINFSAALPDGYDWAGIVFEPVIYGRLEPAHLVNGALLMLIITMLAALIPAWRLLRLKPVEVLR